MEKGRVRELLEGTARGIGGRVVACLRTADDGANHTSEEQGPVAYPRLVLHGDGDGLLPSPELREFVSAEAERRGLPDGTLATLLADLPF